MHAELVARDDELAVLDGWLAEAAAGTARIVLVAGEAGVGKSRLIEATLLRAEATGARTAVGRASEVPGAPPYWPWSRMLAALALPDPMVVGGDDPVVDRFARFEVMAAQLCELATASPVVLALDDLHRADQSSLQLLVHVADRLQGHPVALLLAHRTVVAEGEAGFADCIDALRRMTGTRSLDLRPLDRDGVAALLAEPSSAALVDRVHGATDGNPLLVLEIAAHLAAGGDLADVPTGVRSSVAARLGRLSPGAVEVLRAAALAGREFAVGLVATVTGRPSQLVLSCLDEAIAAGLVEALAEPGAFRFRHLLVRDAVVATIDHAALPALHRALAEAIEVYEGATEAHFARLAHHWEQGALDDPGIAADWWERAGDAADQRLAWDEAARWYERAIALSPPATDPEIRHRRLLAAARARLHGDEISNALRHCREAIVVADGVGRPELAAEALLVPEDRGPALAELTDEIERTLARLPVGDHARRARLLGLLATGAFYRDPDECAALSAQALAEADLAGDPVAEVAALRALQLAAPESERGEIQLDLAARIGSAGRALRRPSVAVWEPVWRTDALVELGRLGEAAAMLPELRRCTDEVGLPMARWHRFRLEAVVAQALGRYDEAEAAAEACRLLFAAHEDPDGATAMWLGFRCTTAIHRGASPGDGDAWDALLRRSPPGFIGDLAVLGPAVTFAQLGDLERARGFHDRLPPVDAWRPPRFLTRVVAVLRVQLVLALDRPADLPGLVDLLAADRGRHVSSSTGSVTYMGPVDLWLGAALARLGRHDEAALALRSALAAAAASGARAFEAHAAILLAEVLAATGAPRPQLVALASDAERIIEDLQLTPWRARCRSLLGAEAGSTTAGPLSPREMEVAALVADGLTNKEIAERLYLSDRTAQNHVQHILTKLGYGNRTQVATWYRDRHG